MTACVLWDWNGTLLNDVIPNWRILNRLMLKRGLAELSLDRYRSLIRMPIIDFYIDIGFTFEHEPFDSVAKEYFRIYEEQYPSLALAENAVAVLEELKGRDVFQCIVSATPQRELLEQVKGKKIERYFDEIIGNDNYEVASKKHRAMELIHRIGECDKLLFIGDMDHDSDVAEAIRARCLLYSKGHQELRPSPKYEIIHDLREVLRYVR